jgi:hypothetical protein
MSVALWINLHPEKLPRAGRTLIARGKWSKEGWWLGLDKQRRLAFQYRPAKRRETIFGRYTKEALPEAQWVHVVAVVRTSAPYPNGIEIFINGKPTPLAQGIGGVLVAASKGPLTIGAMNTDNGGAVNAIVDDVRLYNKPLIRSSIQALVAGQEPLANAGLQVGDYISTSAAGRQTIKLQQLLTDAFSVGMHVVKLPAGKFYLARKVSINGIAKITLAGSGADKTRLVGNQDVMFSVDKCRNVTFRDFSVDVAPLPYIQATVTGFGQDAAGRKTLDFKVHDGYPRLTDQTMKELHGCAYFFDKDTRKLKEGRGWFGPKAGENVFRIDNSHGWTTVTAGAEIGDFIVLKIRGATPFVLRSSNSVSIEDVNILASGGMAVGARFLTGHNYFRYTIKPGPPPTGAVEPRLVSTNADGMQYFWCPGGVTFEGCDFGFVGDDCINISIPQALQVVKVESSTRVLTSSKINPHNIKQLIAMSSPGDIIRTLRYGTFEPLDDVPLKTMTYQEHRNGVQWLADERGTSQGEGKMAFVTVEFQRPPARPLKVGDRLSPRKFLPEKFVIRNSRFHDTRARGLLVMASNGVIENNTIEHTYLSGIELCHEIAGCGGLGWVSNVTVRGNILRNVCICAGPEINCWAAILLGNAPIAPYKERPGTYPWAMGHANVAFVGNTVERCYGAGILINGLAGGIVKDNVIRSSNLRREHPRLRRKDVTAPHPVTIMNSKGIKVSNNQVIAPGPEAVPPLVKDLGVYPPVN